MPTTQVHDGAGAQGATAASATRPVSLANSTHSQSQHINPSTKSEAISMAAMDEHATIESKLETHDKLNGAALESTNEWQSERPKATRPLSTTNITMAYEYVPEAGNPWVEDSNTDSRRRSEEKGKGVEGRWEQTIESYDWRYETTNGEYHDTQHMQSSTNNANAYRLDAYNAYTSDSSQYESDSLRTYNSHTSEETLRGIPTGAGLASYEPHNTDDKIPTLQPFQTYDSGISDDAGSTASHNQSFTHDPAGGGGGGGDAYDDAMDDSFSDFADSDGTASFYSSLRSYATDYYWENGRRYHSPQSRTNLLCYPLPNDETELDREDMKHHEWMLITNFRHFLAPLGCASSPCQDPSHPAGAGCRPPPQRILDLGTGTGIWAMQVADLFPSAEVIGTDISPVQPKWVPPNLSFEVDDLEEEWLYRENSFDLVNVRFMFLAIKSWPSMLQQAFRVLKSGGYIELTELGINPRKTNESYDRDPLVIFEWLHLLRGAMVKVGLDMTVASSFKSLLEEAGFVDVVETRFEIPWGTWAKERREKVIGFWHIEQLKQGLQGIIMRLFSRVYGWSPERVELFLVALRRELDDKEFHMLDHG
jgi:hypothetical protein